MWLFNLLEESVAQNGNNGNSSFLWVLLGILVLFLIYSFFSGKKRRKQMEEEKSKREDIHPGYKVTTIGGIVGTVVAVDEEENSFVLETGYQDSVCMIKFDKQAIYTSLNPDAEQANQIEGEVASDNPEELTDDTVFEGHSDDQIDSLDVPVETDVDDNQAE